MTEGIKESEIVDVGMKMRMKGNSFGGKEE